MMPVVEIIELLRQLKKHASPDELASGGGDALLDDKLQL